MLVRPLQVRLNWSGNRFFGMGATFYLNIGGGFVDELNGRLKYRISCFPGCCMLVPASSDRLGYRIF